MFTFALTGRGMIGCGGLPRATLRLPWAMEVIGLSAHLGCQGYALPWAFSPQGSTGLCATIVFSARLVNSAIRQSHAARKYFAHRSQIPCGVLLSKNTDITDAHGWVFSRIVYSCSAAYCLGFDAPPAQRIATDFSHAENLSMRARFSGHALLYSN